MLYIHKTAGVTQPDLIAGMTEHEEGDKYEGAEHDAHDHQPLFVRKTVAQVPQSGRELPLRGAPHLIIYGVSRGTQI